MTRSGSSPWSLALGALVLCLSSSAAAQTPSPGTLDVSFGGTGIVRTGSVFYADSARDIVLDDEGRILVAGGSDSNVNGLAAGFVVLRYLPDGRLDPAWGGYGVTPIETPYSFDEGAEALAIQSDGRIVVVGYTDFTLRKFVVVRYNTDGTLDTGFGQAGKVVTDLGASAFAHALALPPDGKILVAGYT